MMRTLVLMGSVIAQMFSLFRVGKQLNSSRCTASLPRDFLPPRVKEDRFLIVGAAGLLISVQLLVPVD
jgi:hypothetical protein